MIKKILSILFLLLFTLAFYIAFLFLNRGDVVWILNSDDMSIQVEEIASGLGIPWGMDFLDKNTLIYTERTGNIGILDTQSKKKTVIKAPADLFVKGECGLLDVKVSPSFAHEHIVYFTYAKDVDGYGFTSLAKARVEKNNLIDWEDIFTSKNSRTDDWRHCGSRLTFDGKGHLYMSLGDRGFRPNSQDLNSHAGTIVRLNRDGSVPQDNPFVGIAGSLPEIWSYGHRNPQGLFYEISADRLWSNEHGPRGGDEINLIKPGKNYGWPITSHGKEYTSTSEVGESKEKDGIENPLKIWSPSIAPSSLLFYQGQNMPGWSGDLFSTSLVQQHVNRLVIDSTGRVIFEERLLEEIKERFRAIIQDNNGYIYVSTDSGRILKISIAEENFISRSHIFKHLDLPGFYFSFDINFMLDN